MTNSERRISHLSKIIDAPGEALPDAEILCRFAQRMGYTGFDYDQPSEIFDEHTRLTKKTSIDISALSYERLQEEGTFQWPVNENNPQGTDRLFKDHQFYTPSRKARFFPVDLTENLSDPITHEFPLILTTGRIRDQWHTMTKTGKVNKLRQHIDKPFLEMHPVDAAVRGIHAGDPVIIRNQRGEVRVCVEITDAIKPGVVFLPMHWGKMMSNDLARANNLTSPIVDPVSKEPDFKFSAVEVLAFEKPVEKIVVVGAGAAAYRFLCTYRALNQTDDITILSKEIYPFYNRVLLPEYVNGNLAWKNLQKFHPGELEELHAKIYLDTEIRSIDRNRRTVTDGHGNRHEYDKLILATGTRAHIPNDAPIGLPGIFTMRTRHDADRLKEYVRPNGHVLVIGGGLLGLELAASLREIDLPVSILQLGSRLMERQIDAVAGELLLDFIEEKDIAVYVNDQVQSVVYEESTETLVAQLRSGRKLSANAIVYAVGTRPNIEFATDCGLESGRGIFVNDQLQTSDPNIFAIGEIAEHRGITLGITSAAEKQADVLAHFIHGDAQSLYDGAVAMNILKLSGLDLCSIGLAEIPPDGKGYDEILFIDKSQRYYKKCIIKDDRLVGAILIGDKGEFAEFKNLIENGLELSDRRMKLLRSGKASDPVLGKLICSCNQVGEGNLQAIIDGGCHILNDICQRSGAGLGCGSCKPEIQAIIKASVVNV